MENKNKKVKKLKEKLDYIKKCYDINEEGVLECDDKGRVLLYNIALDEWYKRMWKWLATYSSYNVTKKMFIDANFEDENTIRYMLRCCGNCFACLYNHIVGGEDCELCPIDEFKYQNGCLDGLYNEYMTISRKEQAKKSNLAKKIAELDWEWK